MKKILGIALLAAGFGFAQIGMEGGSDGLHQINAKTLGQWNFTIGTGGNVAFDAWALSRGGDYEMNGKHYSYNDLDNSHAGNIFLGVGLLDFLDVGAILPLYYEHANSNGPSGETNQWTTSRGDLDLWSKIRLPFDTNGVFGLAIMLNMYVPTGEQAAGVRPRHVWYLRNNGYTHPFTADDWAFSAGLAGTADLTKRGIPFRINAAASYLHPLDDEETHTLVYSAGVNFIPKDWIDVFLEYSAEMRLQGKGEYKFSPMDDPMLITPGVRFHLPYNIDFAMGLDVAVRTFKNLGYDYKKEVKGCEDMVVHYTTDKGQEVNYCYASTPLIAGAALLTVRFGGDSFRDTDGDGVNDAKDKCRHTKKGIAVDEEGCPLDTDKDGVVDTYDKCPNTPDSVQVNTDGCADKDSVIVTETNSAADSAANAARADSIRAAERARLDSLNRVDSDKDGIPDRSDKCPNTPAGIAVDYLGCMLDFDRDGVPDNLDKCPNTREKVSVDSTGCPMDFDKDGVPNDIDKCPNTKEGLMVDSTGCPSDSDKDGVFDGLDKCPGTPAGMLIDSVGCPMDNDRDGVPNNLDKCPNTLQGVTVKEDGCPVNKKENLDELKKGIQFKSGSATLTKNSYGTLNDIATLMLKIPSANLEVQGHTDNTGSEQKNLKLSQDRAQSVVDFLVKKGVPESRLRAVGYGPEMPIADNSTKEGRAKNRRVELIPFEK